MTAPRSDEPRARRLRAAGTALATLVVVVGLAEAVARRAAGDLPPPRDRDYTPQMRCGMHDPDLGWRLRPGATGEVRAFGGAPAYTIAVNERGLRDDPHPHAKPPGVRRVLLLGDSVAFGSGMPVEETFAALLEERLGPGVEVVNSAVPGWSTDQQGWWLESEGLRYEPDLVLLTFVVNDLPGNARLSMHGMRKPRWVRVDRGGWRVEGRPVPFEPARFQAPPSGLVRGLVERSALFRWAWWSRRPDAWELQLASHAAAPRAVEPPRAGDGVDASHDATVHALRRLRAACEGAGAPLVAVYVPYLQDMGLLSPEHPGPRDTGGPILTPLSRYLAEVGFAQGFRAVAIDRDLLEAVRRGETLMLRPDGHLNARGHAVVADALARRLAPLLDAAGG